MTEEENLITIFKQMKQEMKKLREIIDTQTMINYEIATQLPAIIEQMQITYNIRIDKAIKLFQWYAEKRTGRKYTWQ